MENDYYDILGVPQDSTKEEIKRAFSILAHQFHPDKNDGNDKRFKQLTQAYRILSDEKSRREYDQRYRNVHKDDFSDKEKENTRSEKDTKSSEESILNKNNTRPTFQFVYFFSFCIFLFFVISLIVVFSETYGQKINSIQDYRSTGSNSVNLSNMLPVKTTLSTTYQESNSTKLLDSSNEKCIDESYIKICDLKFSSHSDPTGYRNVFLEGTNNAACVDMKTGGVIENSPSRIRASSNPSFCASDYGYVYIDPTLKVAKFYEKIIREGYESPYKINSQYDTCLWAYQDGNGAIPYLDVLSSVGPRSGYSVAAFCKNGTSQVDIYTFKE